MYKLIVLFRHPADPGQFEENWPAFVVAAEKMPGVLRVEVGSNLVSPQGPTGFYKIHEFYFDSRAAMDKAMMSQEGVQAGNTLQMLAPDNYVLLFADVQEDIAHPDGEPQKPDA